MLKPVLQDLEFCALTMIGQAIIHYDAKIWLWAQDFYEVIAESAIT